MSNDKPERHGRSTVGELDLAISGDGIFASRRNVLLAGLSVAALPVGADAQSDNARDQLPLTAVDAAGDAARRPWLGHAYWANRPQDWARDDAWISCLRAERGMEVRAVGVLTRDLGDRGDGVIEFVTMMDDTLGQGGFGGILFGVGEGRLHHMAAALAQRGSGGGGGMLAVIDAAGRPAFREHTSDDRPLAFGALKAETTINGSIAVRSTPTRVRLEIEAAGESLAVLTLRVRAADGSGPENVARLAGVPSSFLKGGISLVSSPPTDAAGARFRFRDLRTGGDRIRQHPDRAIGPCVAALYSLANGVLKLAAHFQTMGPNDAKVAVLECRVAGTTRWRRMGQARIGFGNVAPFRVENWDGDRAWDYRVSYAARGRAIPVFEGGIARDPAGAGRTMTIAMYGCISSVQFTLEADPTAPALTESKQFGRYAPENFCFPHQEIVAHGRSRSPDLIFVSGDQYYEGNPTRGTARQPDAIPDTIYRFHQWLVAFRDLIRDRPTIILVDDHDVLQGNLWGDGGRAAPEAEQNRGGFAFPEVAKLAYAIQCAANPDPHDAAPVGIGLPVFYCAFTYGGTSFAIIEDRKWKTTPMQGTNLDVHVPQLLGSRQEAFLAAWKTMHPGLPKVLLTQSLWATLQTSPTGEPVLDFDSNGYPPRARRHAVKLAADAKCIMLAGDQHLPSLVRLGVDRFEDGPIQFAGPAGGTLWQRWFEGFGKLPNPRDGDPNTGDFEDAFGNKMNVLAVANPKLTFADFRKQRTGRPQDIRDRALKSEGFGLVRLDHASQTATFECWPWDVDPTTPGARQFSGWPYAIKYDQF